MASNPQPRNGHWRERLRSDAQRARADWDAARLLLCCAAALTALLYWPGLSGPFLFDDAANLSVFRDWYNGRVDWRYAVFGRTDLISARPVSMASFLVTVAAGGPGPLSYKVGNLLLHLACGVLGFGLLRRLLAADAALAPQARLLAAAAVALWWLHPIQVSTVLYSVQRMAQLAALFSVAAVLAYWIGRQRLAQSRPQALAWLFLAFPLLTVAGVLSKQNAAIAPALCLVLELVCFRGPRPAAVRVFFGVFLALPVLLAAIALTTTPWLGDGYAEWDFSPAQRLLTQARALLDYLGTLLWPRGERMSLFGDDFPLSSGLWSAPSPLPAIAALAAISAAAWALRRRAPMLCAGWFWFLVAHAVESGVLPLEMYYEHRNYLPSLGLALAVTGVAALLPARARAALRPAPVLLGTAALGAVLAWSAHGRVDTWRSKPAIVANALRHHPDSLRARQTQAFIDLSAGRADAALAQMDVLARSPLPRRRLLARIDAVSIACLAGRDPDPAQLQRALADRQPQITLDEVLVADLLAQASAPGRCPRIATAEAGATVQALLAAASAQPDRARPKLQLRLIAALLLAREQRWAQVQRQAELAWTADAPPEVADLLIQAYLHNGRTADARRTLQQLQARTRPYDRAGQALIAQLHGRIQTH